MRQTCSKEDLYQPSQFVKEFVRDFVTELVREFVRDFVRDFATGGATGEGIRPRLSFKFVPTCPNLSKSVQSCAKSSEFVQIHPNLMNLEVPSRPNSSKIVRICPNSSRGARPGEHGQGRTARGARPGEHGQGSTSRSEFVRICRILSHFVVFCRSR